MILTDRELQIVAVKMCWYRAAAIDANCSV